MKRRHLVGLLVGVAWVILTIILEAYVLDEWTFWALVMALGGVCATIWLVVRADPDRRKTHWEKRLPELKKLAAHLGAVNRREALLDPLYVVELGKVSAELAERGILHPRPRPLRESDLPEWETYLVNLIDRVERGKAKNLHPLYREVREAMAEQRLKRAEFERKLFGPNEPTRRLPNGHGSG